ncbi:hypothetical protein V1478_006049 [Vespula squamosa]|uniref:Uncharacterized protein n=1 Tax=Vespula squamosa TaxID=30214 RepID=A0ABD2B946_VESSQ
MNEAPIHALREPYLLAPTAALRQVGALFRLFASGATVYSFPSARVPREISANRKKTKEEEEEEKEKEEEEKEEGEEEKKKKKKKRLLLSFIDVLARFCYLCEDHPIGDRDRDRDLDQDRDWDGKTKMENMRIDVLL